MEHEKWCQSGKPSLGLRCNCGAVQYGTGFWLFVYDNKVDSLPRPVKELAQNASAMVQYFDNVEEALKKRAFWDEIPKMTTKIFVDLDTLPREAFSAAGVGTVGKPKKESEI